MQSTKGVDSRTDIWALGVVLFELVTGRPPFEGETHVEIAVKVSVEPAPILRTVLALAPLEAPTLPRSADWAGDIPTSASAAGGALAPPRRTSSPHIRSAPIAEPAASASAPVPSAPPAFAAVALPVNPPSAAVSVEPRTQPQPSSASDPLQLPFK